MPLESNSPADEAKEMEIISTRVFSAPREVVFDAFSDPDRLAKWWGPNGFRNTFHEFDLRPGGSWRFTMHGPDGTDFQTEKEFVVVARPERIIFNHLQEMHRFQMCMTFDEVAEGTKLTWRMLFEPNAGNEKLRGFIVEANEQNFDRLEASLSEMPR